MENSEDSSEFTRAENKIRKRWLFLTTIFPAIILALIIVATLVGVFYSLDFLVLLWSAFLFSLIFSPALYLNYYCAYKNPGTILLLLMMIGSFLNLLEPLFNSENITLMKEYPVLVFIMPVIFIFQACVLYYSYKLRKINKKMKERRLTSSPAFVNALSVFSTAINIDELNDQFARLRDSHNSEGGAMKALSKAYDQQKKRLTLAKNSL